MEAQIETIITLKLYTSKEIFDGKEFQEALAGIKSGEWQRDWKKSGIEKAIASYTTNRKKKPWAFYLKQQ